MGSILTNPSPPQLQRSQIHSDQNSESVNGLAQKWIEGNSEQQSPELARGPFFREMELVDSRTQSRCNSDLIKNDSPFHSKTIRLSVVFPPEYPRVKPEIRVKNPELFFHPNIANNGFICEQSMKSNNPATQIRERIEGFSFILTHPN